MMFVSSEDLPASVVVRDGSGQVVLEREAHPRPGDNDELMGSVDAMGEDGDMTLVLDEGLHEVECRPRDGAATAVPLRVAWDPDGSETTTSVVLRIYELRDDQG